MANEHTEPDPNEHETDQPEMRSRERLGDLRGAYVERTLEQRSKPLISRRAVEGVAITLAVVAASGGAYYLATQGSTKSAPVNVSVNATAHASASTAMFRVTVDEFERLPIAESREEARNLLKIVDALVAQVHNLSGMDNSKNGYLDERVREIVSGLNWADIKTVGEHLSERALSAEKVGNEYEALELYSLAHELLGRELPIGAKNNYSNQLIKARRRMDLAERLILSVLKQDSDNPAYKDTYGCLLIWKQAYPAAAEILESAYWNEKSSVSLKAQIAEHLGDNSYMRGSDVEALAWWRKAIDHGSASERIMEKVRRLD